MTDVVKETEEKLRVRTQGTVMNTEHRCPKADSATEKAAGEFSPPQ